MAKDNTTIVTPVDLWAGMNNEQRYGDDLLNQNLPKRRGIGQQWLQYKSTANYATPNSVDKVLQTVTNSTGTNTTGTGFDFSAFFAENKMLVLGVLGVGAYLLFARGGGGLAESTVIKRFNTRK